ncbi:MAG: hypothetical protein E4H20_10545, partial [Spirochaetales bacterium]
MNLHDRAFSLGRALSSHPWIILGLSGLIVVASTVAAGRLQLETAIEDMLPTENVAGQSYIKITEQFSTTSSLVIAVENPDRDTLLASAEAFARKMRADPTISPLVRNVRVSMDRAFLERWGFLLAKADELEDQETILAKTNLLPFLQSVNNLMESKLSDGSETVDDGDEEAALVSTMAGFELFARDFEKALTANSASSGEDATPSVSTSRLVDDALFGDRYMTDAKGNTLLMIVTPSFDLGDRKKLTELTEASHEVAAALAETFPDSSFRFAGEVAGEADEEKSLGADSFYPSMAALVVIFILFLFSFDRIRSIVFALITLIVGILADLGFAAVAIGKLNMITSSFGVLLVGLGIDFCIHLATRFDDAVAAGTPPGEAMADSFSRVLVPVSVGALTTAGAFYSLALSHSLAFRQFGMIAGTGILTCLVSTFTVLPALLAAFPGKVRGSSGKRRPMIPYSSLARTGAFFARNRMAVIIVACLSASAAVWLLPG